MKRMASWPRMALLIAPLVVLHACGSQASGLGRDGSGTNPPTGAAWRFVVYGDTRTNDSAHRSVLSSIMSNTPDYKFIVNVGDVVNSGSSTADWSTWQTACDGILGGTGQSQTPPAYMACPGNHDAVPGAGESNWTSRLSGQVRYGNGGRFFTFDYENARVVVLNSQEGMTGAQLTMLNDALTNNPKTWLFTVWHRPIFDFGPKVYEGAIHTTWGQPLYEHGGDIMFMGHSHYYVRSKKLRLDGTMNPPVDAAGGTVQIVTGNGGAPPYQVVPNTDNNGYMVEAYTESYGYTELTVDGSLLTMRHILADGTVFDRATYSPNPKPTTRRAAR